MWDSISKSFVPVEIFTLPLTVKPVNVPTLVIFVCSAVSNFPVRLVVAVILSAVRFPNELIFLLASTTTALLASTVPSITVFNVFKSAALDSTKVPPNLRPFIPSWDSISKSFAPSSIVTFPSISKPVNVPTLVIFGWSVVCNSPVRLIDVIFVAVRFLNELISLL